MLTFANRVVELFNSLIVLEPLAMAPLDPALRVANLNKNKNHSLLLTSPLYFLSIRVKPLFINVAATIVLNPTVKKVPTYCAHW